MRIRLAEHAGFCSGVKKAVETALQESSRGDRVLTLGPLVHNEAVALHLARHNVIAVENPEQAAEGILLIRTHGVSPAIMDELRCREQLTVIDLTCPKVRRIQKLARRLAKNGLQIIIYGDARHPEVKGVIGWAGEKAEIDVVASAEDLKQLTIKASAALIAQTTGQSMVYAEIKAAFLQLCPGGKVYDTLCPETGIRQREAVQLAKEVEAMVVVGSANSANTRALAEACQRLRPTLMVAGAGELDLDFLRRYRLIGVTAGASTPHWMIKEVVARMENEKLEVEVNGEEVSPEETIPEETVAGEAGSAEEVSEETAPEEEMPTEVVEAVQGEDTDEVKEETGFGEEGFDFAGDLNVVQVGEQITGKVVRAAADEVYLDINYKTEALLPAKEVYLQEGETLADRFEPGQEIEVTVIDIEDRDSKVVVSHKRLARDRRWQELHQALEEQTTEEGKVKQVVNAGMVLDLGEGIDGFMPGSLVDLRYIPDFKPFLDEKVKFKVIELNREKDKVILSRKKVIEEENLRKKEETLRSLEIGATIPGVVRRLIDFGAFVDIGGIDGLVHISEISWERVDHPQDVLKVGQEIEVKVLDVIPERERISLSLRRTQPDPWTKAMQELKNGEIVKGKITRLVNFGAFVELRPGVEGLVHISQIADYHVKHPSEVLQEGEEVDVKILELKPEAKRISLSIKEVRKNAYPEEESEEEEKDAGSGGTVTLGDVFGDLFENAGSKDADPEVPEEASGEPENKEEG
ncbi:MAG: bifunctional 4-hydroxy-3-methylbut-2-enyl diphosphate reductase/30S ribosomal protein S1 [Dethiobacteria bacterium]